MEAVHPDGIDSSTLGSQEHGPTERRAGRQRQRHFRVGHIRHVSLEEQLGQHEAGDLAQHGGRLPLAYKGKGERRGRRGRGIQLIGQLDSVRVE